MDISVNGEERTIPEKTNLEDLIQILSLPYKTGIAVAVNNEVIALDNWSQCLLKPRDNILIISATQGG